MDSSKYLDALEAGAADYIRGVISQKITDKTKIMRVIAGRSLPNKYSDGCYFIEYQPRSRKGIKKTNPYRIHCDLFPIQSCRVLSYRDMVSSSKKDKEYLKWLIDYTTISPKLFEIALHNPGLKLFFSIDYLKLVEEYGYYIGVDSINFQYSGGQRNADTK